MDRLSEIRARTIAAGRSKDAEFDLAIHAPEDIPYLLEQINISTARAEKAEAERDTYKSALHIPQDGQEAKNRWIPVSERLPEDDPTIPMHKEFHMEFCSVLAIGIFRGCEDGKPAVSMANRIRLKRTGIRYIDSEIKTEDWQWSAPFESVTHWRPLPEPPKGV